MTFNDAVEKLRQSGIDTARREARWILEAVTGEAAPTSLSSPDALSADQAAAFAALIDRRAAREPLQHVLGDTDFMGLQLKTDARALIPRDDSAVGVELAASWLCAGHRERTCVADLGTGSGALLAALLHASPDATGIAVERSTDALALAQENFAALGLTDRISCFAGSWTDWPGWGAVDVIISNPPYIASAVIDTLDPEVRDHDPRAALDGGADGLAAYREIITLAGAQMQPGAGLVLEIGYDQKIPVTGLLQQANFSHIQVAQDLSGHDRAIIATYS